MTQSLTSTAFPPRIGVLVNNYNNGPWLRTCLDSVLSQTRAPDEIIVYDDGSTDDSLDILKSYQDSIRLIAGVHDSESFALANQGNAVAVAFAASSADHLYLLDGDDAFRPDKIARYEEAWAQSPQTMLVQAPTYLVDSQGHPLRDGYEALKHPNDGDYLAATYRTQDTDLYYSTSALAFHRDYLVQVLPMDFTDQNQLAIDSRLASLVPLYGEVISLQESLTLWRQHERSMSLTGTQRSPLHGTLRRHRHFNSHSCLLHQRPIHLWRNPRYYRQLARHLLPKWVSAPFARNPAGQRSTS